MHPVVTDISHECSTTATHNNAKSHPTTLMDNQDQSLPSSLMREGRTYRGTQFQFQTRTKQLLPRSLNPACVHTTVEWITLATIVLQMAMFVSCNGYGSTMGNTNRPQSDSRHVLLWMYAFWRVVYSVGLGALLNAQSNTAFIVRMFKRMGLGSNSNIPRNELCTWIVDEIVKRMERDTDLPYNYDSMPTELNAWLLFQEICNFVISNDFVAYILVSLSYYQAPPWLDLTLRDGALFVGGMLIIMFNIWLKLDAYVVLKDYSWYWGDFFFFMEDAETFEIGFETLPHPMYSIGYIGYYGVALITHSYTVLFVSLATHMLQILFLYFVEAPHAARTYEVPSKQEDDGVNADTLQQWFTRDLVIFSRLDLFRSGDMLTLFIYAYTVITSIFVGHIEEYDWKYWYYVGQTVFWRIFHTYGLGLLLYLQGKNKFWTRHFIRHGDGLREALQHWKILFNLSITMTYLSFFVCAWRLYIPPQSFSDGPTILKHIFGCLFIILHAWVTVSIYEVRGRLGWFHAEFFIDSLYGKNGPRHNGVYRYLENPLLYTFSCWGLTLICRSWTLLFLTAFGQISNWLFLKLVIEQHYVKLYGKRPFEQSGGQRRSLKGRVQLLGYKVKRVGQQMVERMERLEIIDSIMSKIRRLKDIIGSYSDGDDGVVDGYGCDADTMQLIQGRDMKPESVTGGTTDRFSKQLTMMQDGYDTNIESNDLFVTDDYAEGFTRDMDGAHYDDVGSSTNANGTSEYDEPHRPLNTPGLFSTPTEATEQTHSRSVTDTVRLVVKELEYLVDTAKPCVKAIVDQTKLRVANLANVVRLEDTLSRDQLPLHLYSLSVCTANSREPAEFQLGEPIVIEFTAARETMKSKDWIAVYSVHQNFDPDTTTSKCGTRWSCVSGYPRRTMDVNASAISNCTTLTSTTDNKAISTALASTEFYDETVTPWVRTGDQMHFGYTKVDISSSKDDPGLRVVRGRLVFTREQLPWQVGMFEVRYHYDGQYVVLARSAPFRVSLDVSMEHFGPCSSEHNSSDTADSYILSYSASSLAMKLQGVVERCLDIDVSGGDMPLEFQESMLERVVMPAMLMQTMTMSKYQREVCKRIVYAIKHIYGIDFSWRVVEMARSLMGLGERIHEAHTVLGSYSQERPE
ncbi:hypothetical protein BDV3_003900 [Batrachochytrium dendrobatidis]